MNGAGLAALLALVAGAALVSVGLVGVRGAGAPPPYGGRDDNDASVAPVAIAHGCATLAECEEACERGAPAPCAFAGLGYELGRGAARDDETAFRFYERSCAGGAMVGCYSAAVLLERGQGTAADPGRARERYATVCAAGSATACAAERRLAR
jgi:TPR repeat protein